MNKYLLPVIFCLSTFLSGCRDKAIEIYVSPNGSDSANGKRSDPVASLQRAGELARKKAGSVPVTVFLSGGCYRLTEPLVLGTSDGGTEEARVCWKAIPGEVPVISGGIQVKEWVEESDGSWSAAIPEAIRGKFRSLYFNGRRAVRARHPNSTYLRIDKAGEDERTNFFFRGNEIPQVKDPSEIELIFLHDWSITRIPVKMIDWESRELKAVDSIGAKISFFTITNWEQHPRYFLEGSREFCDSEGEWYADYYKRKLYYRPLPGEEISEADAVIPVASGLLRIKGNRGDHAGYLNFEGITFEHTSWTLPEKGYFGIQATLYNNRENNNEEYSEAGFLPAAIELDLSENCRFHHCEVRHTGGSGIWIRQQCADCEISESHLYDISGNAINIGETRDRQVNGTPWWKTVPGEVSSNNRVKHSLIEDCGKQFYGAVGIWCGIVANTLIEFNEIRSLPYTGISIGWMWSPDPTPCKENIIHANHIHHVMNELSDGGGIYTLGLQPGSRIMNNLIHDVKINAGSAESNGMFLDEGTKELLIENNIVYNIAMSPLRFHQAAFPVVVRNNVLACGGDIPPMKYNDTKEENVMKKDNIILDQTSGSDIECLKEIIEERISVIGPEKKQ